jgi:hypothetical protein
MLNNFECKRNSMVNDYILPEECPEGTNKTIFVGAIQ